MLNGQRVLVVDGSSETQEVLSTVFGPRGTQVERVPHRNRVVATPTQQPDVVVIDMETAQVGGCGANAWDGVPQVIIGAADVSPPDSPRDNDSHCYLEKPFRYPELIQAVERLLAVKS